MYMENEPALPIRAATVFRCSQLHLLHTGFIPCMIMQKDGLKRLTIMLQLILGTSEKAKQIVKHIMYNYSSYGQDGLSKLVTKLTIPSTTDRNMPYLRPSEISQYTRLPNWSSDADTELPSLVLFRSRLKEDMLVTRKITDAQLYPLLAKDILTGIEFKEPRIAFKNMMRLSLLPRLLYMHVMKEAGIPINYNNLRLKVMPKAMTRQDIEKALFVTIYQGFGMHRDKNVWMDTDELLNYKAVSRRIVAERHHHHHAVTKGANTLNWLNLASSVLDVCTIITSGKVSAELIALLCKTLMNISDKYDVTAFMDAWEFLCEKHFKEEDQEALVETLYTALRASRGTKAEKHWSETYDTLTAQVQRDDLSQTVLQWLSTRHLRFNSLYRKITLPEVNADSPSDDKPTVKDFTADDYANLIIIKSFTPALRTELPPTYSLFRSSLRTPQLYDIPVPFVKVREAIKTLCGNETNFALTMLLNNLNLKGCTLSSSNSYLYQGLTPDEMFPENRRRFTDICTWLSTYYVEKNWKKTANKTRAELIREFRNLDAPYPDMDTKAIENVL